MHLASGADAAASDALQPPDEQQKMCIEAALIQLGHLLPPAVRFSDADRQVYFCMPDTAQGTQVFVLPGVRVAHFAAGATKRLWWCTCTAEMQNRQLAFEGLDPAAVGFSSITAVR